MTQVEQTFDEKATHATILPEHQWSAESLPLPLATDGLSIGATIGEGGVGVIHLARQLTLSRDVAVKRLKHGSPAQARAQLLHEARMMGCLEHPNVPPVHALGSDDEDRPVLVMMRVHGHTWEPEHRTLDENVAILRAVTAALAHAHSRGIVHRDLKPENVMLGLHDEVYLMDWGLAVPIDQQTGISGTPIHMAPEMFDGGHVQPAMDVFLVGAMLVLILTGEPRNNATTVGACRKAAKGPTLLPDHVDVELADLARGATQSSPDARPTMDTLQHTLQAWLDHRGAVRLADVAAERLATLRASTELEATVLTECLFALRQAIAQRPYYPPYQQRLHELLLLASQDAVDRDVRLDLAAAWIDELDLPVGHPLLLDLERSLQRVQKSAHLAYEADYQVGYTERFRVYTRWFGLFGLAAAIAYVTGWGSHATHAGNLVVGVLFLLTLLVSAALGWKDITSNLASRAMLGGFILMASFIVVHRSAGWALGIPLQWMLATDAAVVGAINLTLGFTYGRVTRVLGAALLLGSVLVVLAPPHLAGWLFIVPGVLTLLLFTIAVRGGFTRTEALLRPESH